MASIIGVLLLSVGLALQGDTLIDRAKQSNGRAITTIDVNLPAATLGHLVLDSPVIVRGVVRGVRTRLSGDKARVLTEYEIDALEFYRGLLQTFAKPGDMQRITALRTGGRLEVNGLTLGADYSGWPDGDDLRVDEQVIVFLMPDPYEPGQYRIVRSQWGAFRVKGDNVLALTEDIAARRSEKPMDTSTFARELRSLPTGK